MILNGFSQTRIGARGHHPNWSLVMALMIIYGLYRIAARDRLRGLLAAVPVMMIVWMINLEFVPDGPEGINGWLLRCWRD